MIILITTTITMLHKINIKTLNEGLYYFPHSYSKKIKEKLDKPYNKKRDNNGILSRYQNAFSTVSRDI